jgi:formate hydrogenlyase subunit 6/NADH:ubiquinone oxidoreductase subunit I
MMCGLCVEACPFDAICMSHEYELAVTDSAGLMEYLVVDADAATNARHKQERELAEAAVGAVGLAATSADANGGDVDE